MELISKQQAIDALKQQADTMSRRSERYAEQRKGVLTAVNIVEDLPPIQPEIIYCGDGCKFWDKFAGEQKGTCYILRQCTSENFYCGNAKRRETTT